MLERLPEIWEEEEGVEEVEGVERRRALTSFK